MQPRVVGEMDVEAARAQWAVGAPLVGALKPALPIEGGGHKTRPYGARTMFAQMTRNCGVAMSRRLYGGFAR
jgi:hypothetical protein